MVKIAGYMAIINTPAQITAAIIKRALEIASPAMIDSHWNFKINKVCTKLSMTADSPTTKNCLPVAVVRLVGVRGE
jgi:hypothetical protein